MTEVEVWAEFTFSKNDVIHLAEILQIPNQIQCSNRTKCYCTEGLCMVNENTFLSLQVYRFMNPRFGRPVAELCFISTYLLILSIIILVTNLMT